MIVQKALLFILVLTQVMFLRSSVFIHMVCRKSFAVILVLTWTMLLISSVFSIHMVSPTLDSTLGQILTCP